MITENFVENATKSLSIAYAKELELDKQYLASMSSDDRLNADDVRQKIRMLEEAVSHPTKPLVFAKKTNGEVRLIATAGYHVDRLERSDSLLLLAASTYYEVNFDGQLTGRIMFLGAGTNGK